jgi:hypothetical protein
MSGLIRPRIRSLRRRLRTAITLVVLGSQVAVATAVHQHDPGENGVADDSGGPRLIHEIACRAPSAIHWHADRVVEVEPCLACLRQHLAGVHVDAPVRVGVPAVATLDPDSPSSPVAGFILDASSRGPPSAV